MNLNLIKQAQADLESMKQVGASDEMIAAQERVIAKGIAEIPDEDLTNEEYYEKYGEPRGAGADPFGRPDPRTHPEYWTE